MDSLLSHYLPHEVSENPGPHCRTSFLLNVSATTYQHCKVVLTAGWIARSMHHQYIVPPNLPHQCVRNQVGVLGQNSHPINVCQGGIVVLTNARRRFVINVITRSRFATLTCIFQANHNSISILLLSVSMMSDHQTHTNSFLLYIIVLSPRTQHITRNISGLSKPFILASCSIKHALVGLGSNATKRISSRCNVPRAITCTSIDKACTVGKCR